MIELVKRLIDLLLRKKAESHAERAKRARCDAIVNFDRGLSNDKYKRQN